MTRNYRQAEYNFPDWTVAIISRHNFFFVFLIFFFGSWVFSGRTVENFSSLFCFCIFFFFIIFVNWTETAENFSSLFCFVFFFFFFFPPYLSTTSRDSCKKWQEINNKLGLISQIKTAEKFFATETRNGYSDCAHIIIISGGLLSLFFFFLFLNYCVRG